VYSLVGHWTSIKERFLLKNVYVYPDTIFVLDKHAKAIAIKDGINENLVEVFNNPYHAFLRNWKHQISRKALLNDLRLGDKSNKKLVLYAPEPLSNVNGSE